MRFLIVVLLGCCAWAQVQDLTIGTPVVTNEDVPGQGVYIKPGYNLKLQCNYTEDPTQPITWEKDGVQLKSSEHIVINNEKNSLEVENPSLDDAGTYKCKARGGEAEIIVRANVTIEVNEMSKNHVEGDTLTIQCAVTGKPDPKVQWLKDDQPLNMSDARVSLETYNNITDAKLSIKDLRFDDRAIYTCFATNGLSNDTMVVNVRVKDKYAALWPFLGICIEVIVLCVIIFVYEKRRVKPDFDEADNDRNAENKAVTEQKEGQVRQRK